MKKEQIRELYLGAVEWNVCWAEDICEGEEAFDQLFAIWKADDMLVYKLFHALFDEYGLDTRRFDALVRIWGVLRHAWYDDGDVCMVKTDCGHVFVMNGDWRETGLGHVEKFAWRHGPEGHPEIREVRTKKFGSEDLARVFGLLGDVAELKVLAKTCVFDELGSYYDAQEALWEKIWGEES